MKRIALALTCMALFACPQVPPNVTDAGASGSDAGRVMVDAGMMGFDAGTMMMMDAGTDGGVCPSGQRACGEFCADLRLDSANCGACNRACAPVEQCASGQCLPRNCVEGTCAANQVCIDGMRCTDRSCVGVMCVLGSTCVAGRCELEFCGNNPCPAGATCVNNTCVDTACIGVTCPATKPCRQGVCGGAQSAALNTFSSGGNVGSTNMSNATHLNSGVMGEPTPPTIDVIQTNGRNSNQGGFTSSLRGP